MQMNEILNHMMEPRNYGNMDNCDADGIGKNPENSEKVAIYLKIEDNKISDIKFQAIGCTTTIVAGSIFTDSVKGQLLEDADELADKILDMLDTMNSEEAACSEMVAIAYKSSLETYKHRLKDKDYPTVTKMISNTCQPKETKEEI